MANVGDRVGAIKSGNEDIVELFGYGVYQGYKPLPARFGIIAEVVNERGGNPSILLDNGKEVFGCECWWGPEEKVKASIGNRKVIEVDA